MNFLERALVRKYALAFTNIYFDKLSLSENKKILLLEKFLEENRFFYILLRVANISVQKKIEALKKLFDHFKSGPNGLNVPLINLASLLISQRRIHLLGNILKEICKIYLVRSGIEEFRIKISHDVSDGSKAAILKFIETHSKKKVLASFQLAPELIMGLRVEGRNFLFENSVRKRLGETWKKVQI